MRRRTLLGALAMPCVARASPAASDGAPGVTRETIKIGQTMPYSGPASMYGVVGQSEAAVFAMLNAQGGIGGRRVVLLSADDGYSPPRTVEETRRLVESEQVAFMYEGLGTATQSAVQRYLNQRGVPQLFVASGAERWADPARFPWTMGWQPSYRTEAEIYARHLLQTAPSARLAVLYQNDDFGRDYLAGLQSGLGAAYATVVVATASYEVTDPTISSQIITLQGSGADALLTVATPKFAAQTLRRVADLGWRPDPHYLSNVSASTASVIVPAGTEIATGVISGAYLKDATDPHWADDPGMNQFRAWAKQWAPRLEPTSFSTVFGYANALSMAQLLESCGDDLSRENIMRRAADLHQVGNPALLPGIGVSTSPTDYRPIKQLQLMRWTGAAWQLFGGLLSRAA